MIIILAMQLAGKAVRHGIVLSLLKCSIYICDSGIYQHTGKFQSGNQAHSVFRCKADGFGGVLIGRCNNLGNRGVFIHSVFMLLLIHAYLFNSPRGSNIIVQFCLDIEYYF